MSMTNYIAKHYSITFHICNDVYFSDWCRKEWIVFVVLSKGIFFTEFQLFMPWPGKNQYIYRGKKFIRTCISKLMTSWHARPVTKALSAQLEQGSWHGKPETISDFFCLSHPRRAVKREGKFYASGFFVDAMWRRHLRNDCNWGN